MGMRNALLVTAALLALAGCGGSASGADRVRTDRADVERALTQYFHASAFGDGAVACRFLTAQARDSFGALLDGPPSRSCETNAKRVARQSVPLHATHASQVIVNDDRATAYVTSEHPSYSNSVVLARDEGTWKLLYLPAEILRKQLPRVSHPH